MGEGSILNGIFEVFTFVLGWFASAFEALVPIFWTASGLTVIGYLTVAGLSIALGLLVFNIVKSFVKFR